MWHLKEESPAQLKAALYHSGPVNIGLSAENDRWYVYAGGIVDWTDCDTENIDHAVLAVGWGTDVELGDYLIVKNSWGADWGEMGYFKISLSQEHSRKGICGIMSESSLQGCVGKKCDI